MRSAAGGRVTWAGALALVAVLTGCSAFTPTGCRLVGAESGVTVTVAGAPPQPFTVEVCVADRCSSSPSLQSTTDPVFVQNAGLVSSRPTVIVVTVRASDNTIVIPAQRATVTPQKLQPNGPDCEPTVWVAEVTVTPGSSSVG